MLLPERIPAFLYQWVCGLLLGLFALLASEAHAQRPVVYLSVSNPAGPLLVNSTKDFSAVLAPLRQRLQSNGYRVTTARDTLAQLLTQRAGFPFLYADVVCYQQAGSFPTVTFAVRDTLNHVWFAASESTALFGSQQGAFGGAAKRVAAKMPATFVAKPAGIAPTDRAPQFMAYDDFQFTQYLEKVLTAAPIRQQLKRGATLELALAVDALGFARVNAIGGQLTLDEAGRQALESAVRNTPPWGPAYQNGRRTTATLQTVIGRGH